MWLVHVLGSNLAYTSPANSSIVKLTIVVPDIIPATILSIYPVYRMVPVMCLANLFSVPSLTYHNVPTYLLSPYSDSDTAYAFSALSKPKPFLLSAGEVNQIRSRTMLVPHLMLLLSGILLITLCVC